MQNTHATYTAPEAAMTDHTKSPWEARRTGNKARDIAIFTEGARPSSGCICKIPFRDGYRTTAEANVRLITAAPDLLGALKEMAAHAEIGVINKPALARAYDAIAKATGAAA